MLTYNKIAKPILPKKKKQNEHLKEGYKGSINKIKKLFNPNIEFLISN